MMMGWDFGWNWGWMYFGAVMMILFWSGLVALIVLAIRALTGSGHQSDRRAANDGQRTPSSQTPLEILQTRYAKGEIGREEYERMRSELRAS